MNHFHVCKQVKSIFLVTLSVVILVCSVPSLSIKSHALEAAGGYLGSLAYSEYMAIVSYLLTRGYSAPKIDDGTGDYLVSGARTDGSAERILNSLMDNLREVSEPMAQSIQKSLDQAAKSGKLVLNAEQDAFLRSYFDSLTVNESLVVGHTTTRFDPLSANTPLNITYTFFSPQASQVIENASISISAPYDSIPVINYHFNNQGILQYVYIYFINEQVYINSSFVTDFTVNETNVPNLVSNGYTTDFSNGYTGYIYINFADYISQGYGFAAFNFGSFLSGVDITNSVLGNITQYFRLNGYYENDLNYTSDQLYDTSNTDVLSSISEIDPVTGAVAGGITLFLPIMSRLEQIIEDFSNGVISYATAIKQLGLASISDSATVSEKEAALDSVAYPDSTYDWLTSTGWGSETITQSATQGLTDAQVQEETQAETIADLLGWPSGEEPSDEDKQKGGTAMLLATIAMWLGLWEWPDTDPTAPDDGGTDPADNPFEQGRVADIVAGVGVASSLIGDIFDAAGGSSGYGMIFTVGMSFVLFSVIIGAGHFLGGLGNHAEIEAQKEDRKITRETHRNNLEISRIRLNNYRSYKKGG